MELIGKTVILKTPNEEDYPALKKVFNCKETMRVLIPYFETEVWSDQDIIKRFEGFNKEEEKGISLNFVICSKKIIIIKGNCGFKNINKDKREAEFGIILHKSLWGTGAATECFILCLNHAFKNLGLKRVYFLTDEKNLRMRGFFKKFKFNYLNMRKDGTCEYETDIKSWGETLFLLKRSLLTQ